MKRCIPLFLLLCLLLSLGCAPALADGSLLILPLSVKVIEAEAFAGDSSLDEVRLPYGVETIGPRAFAGSSLRAIHLPASLTSIADDAFDGPDKVFITAPEGSYAHAWALANGYLDDTPGDVIGDINLPDAVIGQMTQ